MRVNWTSREIPVLKKIDSKIGQNPILMRTSLINQEGVRVFIYQTISLPPLRLYDGFILQFFVGSTIGVLGLRGDGDIIL